jgi:hypothetical protein
MSGSLASRTPAMIDEANVRWNRGLVADVAEQSQIHIAGNDNFHVIVVDQPDSKRYHPALFRHLRQVHLDSGCWLSAKEAVSIDTHVGPSKESERLRTIRHSDHGRPSVTPSSVDSVKYIEANSPTKSIHSDL